MWAAGDHLIGEPGSIRPEASNLPMRKLAAGKRTHTILIVQRTGETMNQVLNWVATGVVFLLPAVAMAQSSTVTQYNMSTGATLATGDFGARTQTGYNLTIGIGMAQRSSSIGFRAEGMYNEFAYKCFSNFVDCGGAKRVAGLTGNLTYDVVHPTTVQGNTLYAIAGLGYYIANDRVYGPQSQTDIGFNFGGGFKFPIGGFSGYFEARYHTIQNVAVTIVPLTFGLIF
jgi:hypothetical protein